MNAPIRVLVVDDSAVVRQVMSEILSAAPGIEVVGTASDPIFAMAKMRRDWPDVITLDVEMPRMDGISFLRQLMAERPTPVIVCSTLTSRGAETTMQALAAGAVSIIAKPTLGLKGFLNDSAQELVAAVRAAARANLRALRAGGSPISWRWLLMTASRESHRWRGVKTCWPRRRARSICRDCWEFLNRNTAICRW